MAILSLLRRREFRELFCDKGPHFRELLANGGPAPPRRHRQRIGIHLERQTFELSPLSLKSRGKEDKRSYQNSNDLVVFGVS